MDPSTQGQAIGRVQPPGLVIPPGASSAEPQSNQQRPVQPISGPVEQGPIQTAAVAETPSDNDEEDIVQPAKQEVGSPTVPQQKEVQTIEVTPSIPEVAVEKNVENVIEKSPDVEKPDIAPDVQAAGVTHSGPGVPVSENVFAVKSLPMTYQQAVAIDKQTKLKDSKHWLAELVMYVWRKLDPAIEKKGVTK